MSNIFRFKNFSVKQNNWVFKVGTDGVLLGCTASLQSASTILDIGTGAGLIALIVAQRNLDAIITALDSEEQSYNLSKTNFSDSIYSSRLRAVHTTLQEFNPQTKFDYILSNPPYFKITEQLHSKHAIARHQIRLDYLTLLKKSKELIAPHGIIGYILPYEEEKNILTLADSIGLYPIKILYISGIKNGKIKRIMVEFSQKKSIIEKSSFYIESSVRVWSEEYREITKDFYL